MIQLCIVAAVCAMMPWWFSAIIIMAFIVDLVIRVEEES